MSGIRVYEAARKMNVETSKFIKMLARKGIKVKSPISFISQEDLDKVLLRPTGAPQVKSAKKRARKSPAVKPAKRKTKLSLVDSGPAKVAVPVEADVIPIERTVKKENEEPPREEEPEKIAKPAIDGTGQSNKPKEGAGVLTYLALGLAAAAMIIVLIINSGMNNKAADLDKAIASANALSGEITSLGEGVGLNKEMILKNQGSLADLSGQVKANTTAQARSDVMKRSAALKEISSSLPGDLAARVNSLAKELRGLASSM